MHCCCTASATPCMVNTGAPLLPAICPSLMARAMRAYPPAPRDNNTISPALPQSSSTPNTVGRFTARAASAKRTMPYKPLRSVMANAPRPRDEATSASSSGWAAPSRNEKFDLQCSSAYGAARSSVITRPAYRTYVRMKRGDYKPSKAFVASNPPKRPTSAISRASSQVNQRASGLSPSPGFMATSGARIT